MNVRVIPCPIHCGYMFEHRHISGNLMSIQIEYIYSDSGRCYTHDPNRIDICNEIEMINPDRGWINKEIVLQKRACSCMNCNAPDRFVSPLGNFSAGDEFETHLLTGETPLWL